MGSWAAGEVLAFDFETTGIDRFNDVPVSFACVTVMAGVLISTTSALVDPGCDIPVGATEVHGITTRRARAEGMPLNDALELIREVVLSASKRGVPLAGMKLDFDLTILDTQCRLLCGEGLVERGWSGPVLDALVLDRHFDRHREGSRTLGALCAHYGVEIAHAHDAAADAEASAKVLCALAATFKELNDSDPRAVHEAQIEWHREWAQDYKEWRSSNGLSQMDPRDAVWPVAPFVFRAA